jgi:Zn-finger nucleic acid-binding protein
MRCPVYTGLGLKIAEHQGIEIDYFPDCLSFWIPTAGKDNRQSRQTWLSNG